MKKILTLFIALFAFVTISQAQDQAFTLQAGYSWSMGMVGWAYQYNFIEIGAGVMPTSMPGSGDPVTSFSAYVAWTDYKPDESGLYVSLAYASKGYRSQIDYGSGWGDDFTNPMGIIALGYKFQWYSGFNIKTEVGYGFCEYSKVFTYGATVGWTFGIN